MKGFTTLWYANADFSKISNELLLAAIEDAVETYEEIRLSEFHNSVDLFEQSELLYALREERDRRGLKAETITPDK